MRVIGKLILTTLAVFLTARLLPGIHVEDPLTALLVAVFLAILNVTLKPLLIILTIPITIFTFGIFLLFINGLMAVLADKLIDGFIVDGFGWAILFSIVLAFINAILEWFVFSTKRRREE